MTRPRPPLALLCCLALAFACGCARAADPVQAYEAFVRTLQKGDAKAAFGSLSAATRKKLEGLSKELSTASDGGIKDDATSLFFAQLERPQPLTEVALERREGEQATLKISSASSTARVRMVKEEGAWKVDLTDTLK